MLKMPFNSRVDPKCNVDPNDREDENNIRESGFCLIF